MAIGLRAWLPCHQSLHAVLTPYLPFSITEPYAGPSAVVGQDGASGTEKECSIRAYEIGHAHRSSELLRIESPQIFLPIFPHSGPLDYAGKR